MMKKIRAILLVAIFFSSLIPPSTIPKPAEAHSSSSDTRCANHAATNDGLMGFGLFPHSVDLFPGQPTTTTEYMTYVCNGSDRTVDDMTLTRGSGWAWRTNADRSTGRPNAINYAPTGWTGPDSQNYYHQFMGNFGPNSWRSRTVQMGVNEAAFGEPGSYWVEIEGKGRIWDYSRWCVYPNSTCYGETNTITIRLLLTVNRPSITCDGLTLDPALPQVGQSFTALSRYAASDNSLNNTYRLDAYMTTPSGSTVGGNNVSYTLVDGNTLRYTFPIFNDSGGGPYTVRTTLSHPTATWFDPVECETTFTIANYPYFRAYGGDLQAGAGFMNSTGSCSKRSARIAGYNNNENPYTGAGAQLAAFALSQINDFATGTAWSASTPNFLSFARSGSGSGFNPTYGGGLSYGHMHCMPDYFNSYTGGGTDPGASLNINPATDATFYRNGNLVLTQAATEGVNEGVDLTIYVEGDVFIQESITYRDTSSYDSVLQIPAFKLIVKGNIYVGPNVTRLDGLFVAQPTTTSYSDNSGRFYTCGFAYRSPSVSELAGVCGDNRLVVYGAVAAQQFKLTRTTGTLNGSVPGSGEYLTSGGTPAEIFIYSPEMWLKDGLSGSEGFDAIISLPPVL